MQQINDLSAKINCYQERIKAAISRVIASGYVILGPECSKFEQLFADYLNISHCIGVANGTDALELALKAVGISATDRVATVANAGMYTTTALNLLAATPHFMDVDLNTHNTTLSEVTKAVQAGVKAVVVTHLYGLAVPEIAKIAQYCKQQHVVLIEDCAQAHGAEIDSKKTGTFGDIATFSFYPTKNLGALGDGGAVVTDNEVFAQKLRALRQYGWSTKYQVEMANARNSRLDEIQAAILLEFLPYLDQQNMRRRDIASRYSEEIRHPQITTPPKRSLESVAHLYVICSPHRDALKTYLRSAQIASDVHYPIPDYRQPIFQNRYKETSLENTEVLSQQILTLPCYPEMNDKQVDFIINTINDWRL